MHFFRKTFTYTLFILLISFSYANENDKKITKKSQDGAKLVSTSPISTTDKNYDKHVKAAEKYANSELDELKKIIQEQHGNSFITPELYKINEVPKAVDEKILKIKESIKGFIYSIAKDIELGESTGSLELKNGDTSYENITSAKAVNNITLRSIKLTYDLLSKMNNAIITEALNEINPRKKRELYIKQAAMVYEMSSLAIEISQEVALEGTPVIRSIKKDSEEKWKAILDGINIEISELNKKKESSTHKKSINMLLARYESQMKTGKHIITKWSEIDAGLDKQKQKLSEIRDSLFLIKSMKKQAEIQLMALRDIEVIGTIEDTVGSLDDLIDIVKNIPLLEIDKETMKDLLGTGDKIYQ